MQNMFLRVKLKVIKNHPQLNRFKSRSMPVSLITPYLLSVYLEATKRGYKLSKENIGTVAEEYILKVTSGQNKYEIEHLLNKLKIRDKERYDKIVNVKKIETHPLFAVIKVKFRNGKR